METKVEYLVDTNIWLERLLDQDKSDIVSKFLDTVPLDQKYDMTIVTFDKDFNIEGINKMAPEDILGI